MRSLYERPRYSACKGSLALATTDPLSNATSPVAYSLFLGFKALHDPGADRNKNVGNIGNNLSSPVAKSGEGADKALIHKAPISRP